MLRKIKRINKKKRKNNITSFPKRWKKMRRRFVASPRTGQLELDRHAEIERRTVAAFDREFWAGGPSESSESPKSQC